MMKINRNNYEEFFLDFIEGRLSPAQAEELELFLEKNPDLKKELDHFECISLKKDGSVFNSKNILKKKITPFEEINQDNYQHYFIAGIEGDLSLKGQESLKSFISLNTILEKELGLFEKSILKPEAVIFEDKRSLKRTVILTLGWQRAALAMAVAASVLFLLFLDYGSSELNNSADNELVEIKEEIKAQSEQNDGVTENLNHNELNPIERNHTKNNNIRQGNELRLQSEKQNQIADLAAEEHKERNNKEFKENETIAEPVELQEDIETKIAEFSNTQSLENVSENLHRENNGLAEREYKSEDYFTLKEFVALSFRKKVLKENITKEKRNAKVTAVDLALGAVKGVSRFFGSKIRVDKNYDDNGELASLSIISPRFEVNHTMRGK